jgi:hypothetical protein
VGCGALALRVVLSALALVVAVLFVTPACAQTTVAVLPPVDAGGSQGLDLSELQDRILADLPSGLHIKSRRFVEQVLQEYGLHAGDDPDKMSFQAVAQAMRADLVVIPRVYPVTSSEEPQQRSSETAWTRADLAPSGYQGPPSSIPNPWVRHPVAGWSVQPRRPCVCGYVRVTYTRTVASRGKAVRIALALVGVQGFEEVGSGFIESSVRQDLNFAVYEGDPSDLVAEVHPRDNVWETYQKGPVVVPLDTTPFDAPRQFDDGALQRELMEKTASDIAQWLASRLPH